MSDEVKDSLNKKLKNAKVLAHKEVSPGKHELEIQVGPKGLPARQLAEALPKKELAYLSGKDGQPSPVKYHEGGRIIYRDFLRRVDLDLAEPSPLRERPDRLYQRAIDYYKTKGYYGTVVDTLTNFASKGFKNYVDDPDIKLFFDTWTDDIRLPRVIENIFLDFFRVGMVRTFKIVGKFEPRIKPANLIAPGSYKAKSNTVGKLLQRKEFAAAKKTWSKAYIPIKYTVLNPILIVLRGPMMFNDSEEVLLRPEAFTEFKEMLKPGFRPTAEQKQLINAIPKEMVNDVRKNRPVKLPPELVGRCDYRKQDYERYPMPRIIRAFDALDYKEELQKADYSTLDGITNYILKITIGNDENPVTEQAQLEAIANLFDATSKALQIIWNHTLQIEKITFPEVAQILGQDKFKQVNEDLSLSFGIPRSLLDGEGKGSAESMKLASKAFTEEINYSRRVVLEWIYKEYEEVALAMGFDKYPSVRFDDMALKDEIMMMSIVQGMMDRRVISYRSGIEKLGFDYETELANMQAEKPLVEAGDIGIIGSPYNPKATPPDQEPEKLPVPSEDQFVVITEGDLEDFLKNKKKKNAPNVQPTQRTPKGTPSEGRPRKGGGRRKKPSTKTSVPKPTPPIQPSSHP